MWGSMGRGAGGVSRRYRRRASFTLVEILVVIGIIAVLIALLFPVMAKARRKALVLACPIAFVSQGGAVYLTSPTGTAELLVSPPGWQVWDFYPMPGVDAGKLALRRLDRFRLLSRTGRHVALVPDRG